MSAAMVEQSMSTAALLSTSFDGGKEHHHSISGPSQEIEGQSELGSDAAPLAPAISQKAAEKNSSREVIDSQVGIEQSASSLVGNGHVASLPSDEGSDSSAKGITIDDSLTREMPGTLCPKASTDDTSACGGDVVATNDQVPTHFLFTY